MQMEGGRALTVSLLSLVCLRILMLHLSRVLGCFVCQIKIYHFIDSGVKFEVEIKDSTGQISAAIFSEQIEEFYKITSAEIIDNILDDFLQLPMMEKLNEMRHCRANLKVYNYSYGAINQCKFNVVSIFHDTAESITDAPHNPQPLPPTTLMKKAKISNYAESSSPTDNQKQDSDESEAMEDTSDCEDTDGLSKKND